MFAEHRLINVLLDADSGGEGAGTGTGEGAPAVEGTPVGGDGTAPSNPTEPEQFERPKYFAQITPEKAESEEYRSLYKYQKIEELADAFMQQARDVDAIREKYKDSIAVPKPDDVEGVKKFKSALGIPESADGYTFASLKNADVGDDVKKLLQDTAYKACLSDKQAEALGTAILKAGIMGRKQMKAQLDNAAKTFDTTLTASYSDIANEVDRKSAAERDKASYEHFLNETGLKDYLKDRAPNYDPSFVKAIAQYARRHTGAAPQGNLPTSNPQNAQSGSYGQSAPQGFYSNSFSDTYKKH